VNSVKEQKLHYDFHYIKINYMKKVLIIDDEVNLRETIAEMLSYTGHHVCLAKDGIEGLTKVVEFQPDIIICDVMMPELDGYGFVEQHKSSQYADVPVVLLTAKVEQKDEETYVKLQSQFIKRTIKKRYVALLDGVLEANEGFIDLPLRVDLDDRPRQLVCYEHGKQAQTKWEVVEIKNNRTRVYFYPITGRTHQLRVHSSHELGLKTPIVGDDLYGLKNERLFLHAEQITFLHPKSNKEITVRKNAPF